MLLAQHRRARRGARRAEAHIAIDDHSVSSAWDRMNQKVNHADAVSQARSRTVGR